MNFKVILNTFIDTFAVWFRDKILKFYDRPFGENKKFLYSIVLFSEKNDTFEKMAFKTFTSIFYPNYEIILIGQERFESNIEYKFLKTDDRLKDIDKLKLLINSSVVSGEVIVFSKLNSFVDERFLYNVGRILSLSQVGGVGGYIIPSENAGFQIVAHRVLGSFFLNFNLNYRYKPLNFKEVKELGLNGLFIKKEALYSNLDFRKSVRIEYMIAECIRKGEKKLYYSPDIVMYGKFPENLKQLFLYVKSNALSRGKELREIISRREIKFISIGYLLPVLFLMWILTLLIFFNKFTIYFLVVYYGLVFVSRLIYGIKALFDGILISILQFYYSILYIVGILRKSDEI